MASSGVGSGVPGPRRALATVGVELDASRHNAATRLRQHGLTSGLLTPDEAERMNKFIEDEIKPSGGTNFDA